MNNLFLCDYLMIRRYGGSEDDWLLVFAISCSALIFVIRRTIVWIGHAKPERLILKRGTHSFSSPSPHPQIQAGLFSRIITPVLGFGVGICFLLFLLHAPTLTQQLLMVSMSALFFYLAVTQLETLVYPLIRIDDDGIQVKRHKLHWSNIERLHVENDTQNTTTNWRFFDDTGKRLAQVSLQDVFLPRQKEVISIVAEVLKAQIEE